MTAGIIAALALGLGGLSGLAALRLDMARVHRRLQPGSAAGPDWGRTRTPLTGGVPAILLLPAAFLLLAVGHPLAAAGLAGLACLPAALRRLELGLPAARRAGDSDLAPVLELLSLGLRAGATLEQAMEAVVRHHAGPSAQLFRLYLHQRGLGQSRREALTTLLETGSHPPWGLILHGMLDAEELGVPLAGVLEELGLEVRQRRLARMKAQAGRAAPQLALVTVLLGAPSAFILLLTTALLGTAARLGAGGWPGP